MSLYYFGLMAATAVGASGLYPPYPSPNEETTVDFAVTLVLVGTIVYRHMTQA
jgi:hypothetical protein